MSLRKFPKTPKLNLMKLSVIPEPFKNAGANREACQACGLFRTEKANFLKPIVPEEWTGKLVVVCSFQSMTPPVRKLIAKLWTRAKYKDVDVAFVPVVRCFGKEPDMKQLRACRPFLLQSLKVLGPKYVFGLGSVSLKSLRNSGDGNITKARGKLIKYDSLDIGGN